LLAAFACSAVAAALLSVAFIIGRRLYLPQGSRANTIASQKRGAPRVWNDAVLWDSVASPATYAPGSGFPAKETVTQKVCHRTSPNTSKKGYDSPSTSAAWAPPTNLKSVDPKSFRDTSQPFRTKSDSQQFPVISSRYASSDASLPCQAASSLERPRRALPKLHAKAPVPRPGSLIFCATSKKNVEVCPAEFPGTTAQTRQHSGALKGFSPQSAGPPSESSQASSAVGTEPSKMSVAELRRVLECRGVDHSHCIEKTELVLLVDLHSPMDNMPRTIPPHSLRHSHDEEMQREFLAAAAQLSESELRDFVDEHVKGELASVRALPAELRSQAFKRLCSEWHPDKCPAIQKLATEVFQRLQAQKLSVLNAPA